MRQTEFGMKWKPRIGMPARPTLRIVVLVVLDLLVAARQAEHRLVVEVDRHVLDRLERQAVLLGLVDQRPQVLLLPARLAGQLRRVHLHALDADLRGEAQLLVGQLVELPDRDPNAFSLSFRSFR